MNVSKENILSMMRRSVLLCITSFLYLLKKLVNVSNSLLSWALSFHRELYFHAASPRYLTVLEPSIATCTAYLLRRGQHFLVNLEQVLSNGLTFGRNICKSVAFYLQYQMFHPMTDCLLLKFS